MHILRTADVMSFATWMFAIVMFDTLQQMAMSIFETFRRDIIWFTFIQIADEEFEISIMWSVDLCYEVNGTSSLPMSYYRYCAIWQWKKWTTYHMFIMRNRITTQAGASGRSVKVIYRIVNMPSWSRHISRYCGNRPCVQTMCTMVDDGIGWEWKIGMTLDWFVGPALTRCTHQPVRFGWERR